MIRVFCAYATQDKHLMEQFHAHSRRSLEFVHARIWYTHDELAGTQWKHERDSQLQSAHLILFLVSANFISSHEHTKTEELAIERYKKGEARVVPIILSPTHWQDTPLGKLPPLPSNGIPVTDKFWQSQDHAFVDVVNGLKRLINDKSFRLLIQQEEDAFPDTFQETTPVDADPVARLEQIIQAFRLLRGQIANAAFLKAPPGFSIDGCTSQYNRLYGDTMVFLARYLPQSVSDEMEFVEAVHRKAMAELKQRGDLPVILARGAFAPLAKLEKLAAQIDACVATLESYKQNHSL